MGERGLKLGIVHMLNELREKMLLGLGKGVSVAASQRHTYL